MSDQSPSDEELLARLDEMFARDVLTKHYSAQDVEEDLRAVGGDPEQIGREGAAFVVTLLEGRRLSWQAAARQRRAVWASVLEEVKRSLPRKDRVQTLAHLQTLRSDPTLKGPMVAAYHKRRGEDASDDELHELLIEMETLRRMVAENKDEKK